MNSSPDVTLIRPQHTVTIIIPARPGNTAIPALPACQALEWGPDKPEIIVARGRQPAVQRNAAIKAARGEIIYFLDDDSLPHPGNLRRACPHFDNPAVQMVGGPNLCPSDAPWLETVFAVTLGSWLAFGPSRARYEAIGAVRETTEKELILCNLVARRESLLALGGFNEALYPNEENALMDELQKRGGKLIYDPELVVFRRPRPTLEAFAKMLLAYGRGRAEQFRLHPTAGSALNFVPPLFCLYLLSWPFYWLPIYPSDQLQQRLALWLGVMPMLAYAFALFSQGAASSAKHGLAKALASIPLIFLTHLLYGLGFWRGLRTRLEPSAAAPAAEVTLEKAQAG